MLVSELYLGCREFPQVTEKHAPSYSSHCASRMTGMSSNGESLFRLLSAAPRTRELTGAVDLISHYQLREHYESFCKKPLSTKVSDSNYLSNVVGDTELRRGEGMELSQLISGPAMTSMPSDRVPFQPFDLEVLRKAFTLKEAGPIFLPESERGVPVAKGDEEKKKKHKKDRDRHHKKDRDKDKDKDKDKKKDRDKDKKREKDKDKDRSKSENGEKKHKKKKRKHEVEEGEDGHKHKSKKHKHSLKVEGHTMKNGK